MDSRMAVSTIGGVRNVHGRGFHWKRVRTDRVPFTKKRPKATVNPSILLLRDLAKAATERMRRAAESTTTQAWAATSMSEAKVMSDPLAATAVKSPNP